jgi:hypothetical protein
MVSSKRLSSARIHDALDSSCGDSLETALVMKAAENCVGEHIGDSGLNS